MCVCVCVSPFSCVFCVLRCRGGGGALCVSLCVSLCLDSAGGCIVCVCVCVPVLCLSLCVVTAMGCVLSVFPIVSLSPVLYT